MSTFMSGHRRGILFKTFDQNTATLVDPRWAILFLVLKKTLSFACFSCVGFSGMGLEAVDILTEILFTSMASEEGDWGYIF